MSIEVRHIESRGTEIILTLIVNNLPVWAHYCNYSGDIFIDYRENESLLINGDDEIKDYIFETMN